MRRVARVDANHKAVTEAFRAMGCSVTSTAQLGKGFPDLCVGVVGRNLLIEVKDSAKRPSARKLTPDQEEFKATWRGSILYVDNAREVLGIVNAMRRP